MKDITGQKFDMLIALHPTEKRQCGSVIWVCKCDCGNICERSLTNLQRSGRHSCGCYNKEQVTNLNKKDLTNQKFGLLTVLEETDRRTNSGGIIWKCLCDCGNITYVSTNSLTTKNTSSCGCISYSIGEKNIIKLLDKNNINYIKQFSDKELGYKKFDFAILQNNQIVRLIEFDGQQHYNDKSGLWLGKETSAEIRARDEIKNQYAKNHNIPLVRIPYWYRDNLTIDMLLGDKFLV